MSSLPQLADKRAKKDLDKGCNSLNCLFDEAASAQNKDGMGISGVRCEDACMHAAACAAEQRLLAHVNEQTRTCSRPLARALSLSLAYSSIAIRYTLTRMRHRAGRHQRQARARGWRWAEALRGSRLMTSARQRLLHTPVSGWRWRAVVFRDPWLARVSCSLDRPPLSLTSPAPTTRPSSACPTGMHYSYRLDHLSMTHGGSGIPKMHTKDGVNVPGQGDVGPDVKASKLGKSGNSLASRRKFSEDKRP